MALAGSCPWPAGAVLAPRLGTLQIPEDWSWKSMTSMKCHLPEFQESPRLDYRPASESHSTLLYFVPYRHHYLCASILPDL